MGPAGVGKSTYCQAMQEHAATEKRKINIANMDPAAEEFTYDVAFDIRDLITLEDVMDELQYGPNGGLLYCMEYLLQNIDWLKDEIDQYGDDEYLILDCPGQIELYSHVPVMRSVVDALRMWGVKLCGVYLIDAANFACDASKFISGALLSLSAMIQLELPHINVLTKCDLVDPDDLNEILQFDTASMVANAADAHHGAESQTSLRSFPLSQSSRRLGKLTYAICSLLDDFTMVSFLPLNLKDEESIGLVLHAADHLIQYGEDLEPRDCDYLDNQESNDD